MKRTLTLLLALVLALAVFQISFVEAQAADVANGTCGENLTWVLDDSGTLTISGTGAMADYAAGADVPWNSQKSAIASVVVNDGVTTIGDRAFYNHTALKAVTIGSNVSSIGTYAFRGCTALKSVTIPAAVTELKGSAFRACSALSSVTLGGNAPTLGSYALDDTASNLTIHYYENATGFDTAPWTDYTCKSEHIGQWVVDTEATCTTDGSRHIDCSFCQETFTETIPCGHNYVDSICAVCQSVEILDSGDCGSRVNWKLDALGTLTISGTGDMYNYNYYYGNEPWYQYGDQIQAAVIENGVTSIGEDAFYNCSSLKSITIPESVTSIGEGAFHYCSSLESITIPESVTSIGYEAFYNCSSLESITIPESVTSIGYEAFYNCSSLVSITIPGSVASIGEYAFFDCSSLAEVRITDISKWCQIDFEDSNSNPMRNGAKLYVNGELATDLVIPDGVTSIGYYAFYGCSSLKSITIPESVTSISGSAFSGCSSLESITIPESVTSIGSYTFYNCSSLVSITLPESVTSIGEDAFRGCSSLVSITLPESVTSIGEYAFHGCSSLVSITIPESVTSIGDRAFHGCSSLVSITIPESVTSIGGYAFWYCRSLESITIPESVTSIGEYAFCGCSSLVSITIPESVTSIGAGAFASCSSLVSITIPESVTSIGVDAFWGCSSLEDVYYSGTQNQWENLSNRPYATRIHYSVTDVANHWQSPVVTAPTCSAKGYTKHSCSCGYSYKDNYKNALGHKYWNGKCKSCNKADPNFVALALTTQPQSTAVSNGATAKFTVKATGDGLTYKWYYKDKGASNYTLASSKTATFSTTMTAAKNGRKVYCKVTDKYGNTVQSNTVTLTLKQTAKITTQPKNVLAEKGATVKFTVKATGDGLTYKWYYKDKGASNYTLASSKTATFSTTMTAAKNGRKVYCKVTDKYGNTVQSTTVTLTLKQTAKITTQPKSVTVSKGATAKVTVKATGDGLTYKWYYKNKGATKYSVASTTSNTFSTTMDSSKNGRKVYCVVKDKYGNTVQSTTVTLTLKQTAKITTQPKSVTVSKGATAKVTVKATGDGLTYKWYYKDKGASKYTLASSKTATFSTTMDSSKDGRKVYCVVKDKYGNTVQSTTVTLTLKQTAKITTQPKSVTVSKGATAKVTVKATGDGLTYKWYYKDKGASNYTLASSKTATFSTTMTAAKNGRQVYCKVTDKYGNTVKSNVVTLKMK